MSRKRREALASIALATATQDGRGLRVPDDVQRLWFTLTQRPWWSMVLLPGDNRTQTGALAEALAQAGTRARGLPVIMHDAQQLELPQAAKLIEETSTPSPEQGGVIIALGSPLVSPAAIPVALSADAVILCVELGSTAVDAAQQTVELLGRQRFMGTVVLDPSGRK